MWVAHVAGSSQSSPDRQNVQIQPGQSFTFHTPDNLLGMRYWPKFHCNREGNECQVGDSGGPGQKCDEAAGCAPPVDTKFEASFGSASKPDWVDMSLVDGFSVPFKLEMQGKCSGVENRVIDCSRLSTDSCPQAEHVSAMGSVDLRALHPRSGNVVGCYSPCGKLTFQNWGNKAAIGRKPQDAVCAPYCCPTPPESPAACRNGPVPHSEYVRAVHQLCPGVYGYAYDDGMGLVNCEANTHYTVTFFCPTGHSPPTPPSPSPSPGPAPAPRCKVGDSVACPGASDVHCAGNQCCPDGSTCPSAASSFAGCVKPKREDCTTTAGYVNHQLLI